MLLQQPDPQSATCFTCHDGTGALRPTSRSDWSNPALSPPTTRRPPRGTPTRRRRLGSPVRPGGRVRRGPEPPRGVRRLPPAPPRRRDRGRQQRRRLVRLGRHRGASGVAVANGAAGTAPTYASRQTSTFEYELCFKCHSGFTTAARAGSGHPSRWALDKGIELNPANVSYHPVEAAGKNQTTAMAAEPRWHVALQALDLRDRRDVRCLNCHGDSVRRQASCAAGRRRAPGQPRSAEPRDPDRAVQGSDAQRPRGALPGAGLRAVLRLPRRGADGGRQRRRPQRHQLQLARLPHERHQRRRDGRPDIDVPGAGRATPPAPSATSGPTGPRWPSTARRRPRAS